MAKILIDTETILCSVNDLFCLTQWGTVLDNHTNGDVIKALFPNVAICEVNPIEMDAHIGNGVHFVTQFDKDWWDAPYGGINDKRGEI